MKRTSLLILLLLFVPIVPIASYANINVTISDGTTTKTTLTGFNLSVPAPAGANQTLFMLTCSLPPCTRFFPSGGTTALSTDTFKIQDISSTNRARVEKTDVPTGGTATTGADTLILRGIKIFSLTSVARTFTLAYATASGDFSTISSSSGNYAGTAKLTGQFRLDTIAPVDGLSGSIPTQCNSGVDSPCAQLTTKINLLTLNGIGSTADLTVSIPCSTTSGSNSPCGSSGFWSPGLFSGTQFLSTDTGSVGCGTSCTPFWQSTLRVKFNAVNQVFTLANSAATGVAPDTLQGLVDLAIALAEPGIDVWVGSCGGVQTGALPYLVTGLPPFGNTGRNQNDSATFPMKFSLQKGQLAPASDGFPNFESINDPSESILPPGDRVRNDACSMSWVPSPSTRPTFGGKNGISQLTLNFTEFVNGLADSGIAALGTLNFTDCTACFRVQIQLVDSSGLPQDSLIVYLGTEAFNFYRTGYPAYAAPTSLTLLSDPGLRVDASAPTNEFPQPCCISFAEAQKNSDYGKLFVRAITVVIDQGLDTSLNPLTNTGNHLVTNLEAVVNGNSSNASMLTVGNFQPSCEWPPVDGLKIYLYKVDPTSPTGTVFALNVLNPTVDSSCNLTASVNVTDLAGTGTYEATVSAFSMATDPHTEFIGGVSLPNPGEMVLK